MLQFTNDVTTDISYHLGPINHLAATTVLAEWWPPIRWPPFLAGIPTLGRPVCQCRNGIRSKRGDTRLSEPSHHLVTQQKFRELYDSAHAPGALDAKTKELIHIAVALAQHCEP